MSAATFLSLPREIRNIIYGYLSHDIAVDWGYKMFPFPLGGHAAVQISLINAPLPEVLRLCSQVYHEYCEEGRYGKPHLAVDVSADRTWRLLEGQPTNQARVFKILEQIDHVDFFYNGASHEGVEMAWDSIDNLGAAIGVLAPNLRTIRVVAQTSPDLTLDCGASPSLTTATNDTSFTSNEINRQAVAMPLVVHGQQAFWNDRIRFTMSTETGCEEIAYAPSAVRGEWRFTCRKGDAYLMALQQVYRP
jgi:hypothetical protein